MLVHPVISESFSTVLAGSSGPGSAVHTSLWAAVLEAPELLRRFAMVCDGGRDRGREQPVAVVLSLCAAAVLAGMRSFTAIAGWVADVPVELLSRFYAGAEAKPPSKSTLWRVLTGVDPAAVDAVIGSWLAEHAGLLAVAPVPDAGKLLAVAVAARRYAGPSMPTVPALMCWARPPTLSS